MHQIHYWIALEEDDPDRQSPFQGFSLPLLRRRHLIRHILITLPPTVFELYAFNPGSLRARFDGNAPYHIVPIPPSVLQDVKLSNTHPFHVIATNNATHPACSTWALSQPYPVLLRNTDEHPQGAPLVSRAELALHCDSVIACLRANDCDTFPIDFPALQSRSRAAALPDEALDVYGHNTTVPNEAALLSLGYRVGEVHPALCGGDENYRTAILETADRLAMLRSRIPEPSSLTGSLPLHSLILTSPSMLLEARSIRRPQGATSANAREFFDALRAFQSNTSYALAGDEHTLARLQKDSPFIAVLKTRSDELAAYTDAIATRACSYLSPVLRLHPAVERTASLAIQLADCIRADTRSPRPIRRDKLRKLAEKLFDGLAKCVDSDFADRIAAETLHVKVISGAPLQWLPVKGIPLMLRHSMSRIPATPGNVAFREIMPRPPLHISMSDFAEVLVIRAFQPDDSIKYELQDAVRRFIRLDGSQIPARFVDVASRDEFIAALNSFSGAMAILDCHGMHRQDMPGQLLLTGGAIDVFSLRGHVRMPPIIVTCACDTFALSRNHATTAAALLSCGAVTVLATVLPVESRASVRMAARLLFGIYEFLGKVAAVNSVYTRWEMVITITQRNEFIWELAHELARRHTPPQKTAWLMPALVKCGLIAHHERSQWYEAAIDCLATESGLSVKRIEEIRAEYVPFPEILKYVQIGNPDLIIFGPAIE